ncbi:MAG: hypothetical protein IKZ48_00035 [Prevotella sp.]|nr:hypothetical protein [Prevotella sp.]
MFLFLPRQSNFADLSAKLRKVERNAKRIRSFLQYTRQLVYSRKRRELFS